MKITIIGAGNGGMTAAYHLTRNGHEICLYDSPEFDLQIRAVKENGGIRALDRAGEDRYLFPGFEKIALATTDMKEAVDFAEILWMICPSFAQEILFERMLPYLRNGQILCVLPGNFAGLVFNKMLKEFGEQNGMAPDITLVDAISIPWATRLAAPGTLAIMGMKQFLPVSIFPKAKATEDRKALLQEIFPLPIEFLSSPLEAGLENINFGGHPLMTTVNIGLLENNPGGYTYYYDCCSPSTAKAAAKMDLERLAVGKAYGLKLRTELEAMNALYAADAKTVYEFNRGSETHGKVKDSPHNAKARYITEDVPYLLVPILCLAKAAGLSPVLMESIVHLADAYNDADYLSEGRTLEKMGLEEMTVPEIQRYLDIANI